MAFNHIDPIVGAQNIADKSTTLKHKVGEIRQAWDSTLGVGEFVYLKGVASTAVGSWVSYAPGTGLTALAAASVAGPLAVSMSTNTTTASYGWYQIGGTARALGLTSITATSGFLFLSGTSGSVDDASVIGDAIFNAKKTATVHVVGTFLDTYTLARPFATNRVSVSN